MYGTVARMKVKPGELEQLQKALSDWGDQDPKAVGAIATHVYQLDADQNELIMAVLFRDRDSYFANADDPKTDEWFQRVRAHLEADPEWNDGEIISSEQY